MHPVSERLPSGVLASSLIRRVNDVGGFATVRARGDAQAGGILVVACHRAGPARLFERGVGPAGAPALIESTPTDGSAESIESYWRKRRARDPDLWVIELDVPGAERFAAETLT
jgi:hypothetical protein